MKRHVIVIPFLLVMGLVFLLFGLSTRTLHCTYAGAEAYTCKATLKLFKFHLGENKFSNITKAVVANSWGKNGKRYQVQFVNLYGQNISYTNAWTDRYGRINRRVITINKYFDANKDFSYTFPRQLVLIFFGLLFIIVPLIILKFMFYKKNDNGFGDFDAQKFIKKDLSKMSDAEVLAFIKQKNSKER